MMLDFMADRTSMLCYSIPCNSVRGTGFYTSSMMRTLFTWRYRFLTKILIQTFEEQSKKHRGTIKETSRNTQRKWTTKSSGSRRSKILHYSISSTLDKERKPSKCGCLCARVATNQRKQYCTTRSTPYSSTRTCFVSKQRDWTNEPKYVNGTTFSLLADKLSGIQRLESIIWLHLVG